MLKTVNFHFPLQNPGQANRAALNQSIQQIDTLIHVRDQQFTLMAQALQSTNAALAHAVPFGPFTATEGQTDFPLGFDVPPGALVIVSRDHFFYVNNQGFNLTGNTVSFESPSLDGEIINGFVFIASLGGVIPPPSPDGSVTETPVGAISSTDGANGNGVFTLSQTIDPTTIPIVKISGFLELPPYTDFTWSGNTITFTPGNYPVVGETLSVTYHPAP